MNSCIISWSATSQDLTHMQTSDEPQQFHGLYFEQSTKCSD